MKTIFTERSLDSQTFRDASDFKYTVARLLVSQGTLTTSDDVFPLGQGGNGSLVWDHGRPSPHGLAVAAESPCRALRPAPPGREVLLPFLRRAPLQLRWAGPSGARRCTAPPAAQLQRHNALNATRARRRGAAAGRVGPVPRGAASRCNTFTQVSRPDNGRLCCSARRRAMATA